MSLNRCNRHWFGVCLLLLWSFSATATPWPDSVNEMHLDGRAIWMTREPSTNQLLVLLDSEYRWRTEAGKSRFELMKAPEIHFLDEEGRTLQKISLDGVDEPDLEALYFPLSRTLVLLGMAREGKAWLFQLDREELQAIPGRIEGLSADLARERLFLSRNGVFEVWDVRSGVRLQSKELESPALQVLANGGDRVFLLDEEGSLKTSQGPHYQIWETWNPRVEVMTLEGFDSASGRLLLTGMSSPQALTPSLMLYSKDWSRAQSFATDIQSPQVLTPPGSSEGVYVLDQEREVVFQVDLESRQASEPRDMRHQPGWLHSVGKGGEILLVGNEHLALSLPQTDLLLLAHFQREPLALNVEWESGTLDYILQEEGTVPGTKVRSRLLTLKLPTAGESLDSPAQHADSTSASLPLPRRRTL